MTTFEMAYGYGLRFTYVSDAFGQEATFLYPFRNIKLIHSVF